MVESWPSSIPNGRHSVDSVGNGLTDSCSMMGISMDGFDSVDMRKGSARRFTTDSADEDGLESMRNTTKKAHI